MNEAVKKEKLWSRDYLIVMVACSGISFCNYFFSSTLPIYAQNLTGTTVYAGLIMSVYTLSALATRPFTGILADRFGRVKLLIIGAGLCAVACLLYNFASVIIVLIIIRVLHGMGFGIHSTSGGAVAADVIPKERMSEGLGIFGLYGTIASALAPGIALAIIGTGATENFRALFILAAAVSIVSLILDCFIKYERKHKNPVVEEAKVEIKDTSISEPLPKTLFGFEYGVFLPAAVIVLVFIAFSSITSFLTLFARDRDFGNVGIFFTVNAAGLFLSRVFLGKIADRRGSNIVVIPALAVLTVCFALIPLVSSRLYLFALAFPLGLSQGAICPALNTMIFKRCSPQRRGTAAASYFSSIDLGFGVGAMLHGVIADLSYSYVYWAAMLFSALALIIYIIGIIPSNRRLKII